MTTGFLDKILEILAPELRYAYLFENWKYEVEITVSQHTKSKTL